MFITLDIKSLIKQEEMLFFFLKVFADPLTFIPRIDSLERRCVISSPDITPIWDAADAEDELTIRQFEGKKRSEERGMIERP